MKQCNESRGLENLMRVAQGERQEVESGGEAGVSLLSLYQAESSRKQDKIWLLCDVN